ncbi:type II secretion system F family protein [Pelotomaculum propionicicum]|uniref:type II secretion system F family protein n=1 Tax=Pelotomaculum propionicicum TaxID=258475 RepID=UPI003B821FF5
MYTAIIAVAIIFAAVFFVTLSVFSIFTSKSRLLKSRLKELDKVAAKHEIVGLSDQAAVADTMTEDEFARRARQEPDKKKYFTDRYFERLSDRLQKAYLLYKPKEFFMLSLGVALLLIILILIAFGGKYASLTKGIGIILVILIGGGIGFMIPNLYLTIREKMFHNLLSKQIGDMILLISNYLRAGHSFVRSMELVSRELASPLADELKTFTKDMNLGASLSTALNDLEKRAQDEDLGLVITAIQIHHQIGGNLSEILDSINFTIRERIRLKGEIRTLTAQGRMTALVIGALPIVVAVIISYLHPTFMKLLFTEPMGQFMLLLAVVMEVIGIILIRKIIEIEV